MRGLSLTQPWATLVANGSKKVETRSWSTNYRGWLAIQAAKKYPLGFRELRAYHDAFHAALLNDPEPLPTSKIVALVRLIDCIPTERVLRGAILPLMEHRVDPDSSEFKFGDYSPNRFAWMLGDLVRLKIPIECKGALGLFSVPQMVIETLKNFIPADSSTTSVQSAKADEVL